MNYLILVNKSNLIEESYYNDVEFVECKDILGEYIKVEKTAYEAYLKLKEYLRSQDINIGIDSAYRTIEEQQRIIDDYLVKYGEEHVEKYVAPIKASEHHTGLAIDIALITDDKKCTESEELVGYKETFLEIHKSLKDFGFILRYPEGKRNITGYEYEPWHIRYVGIEAANEIYEKQLTLEEYLNNIK